MDLKLIVDEKNADIAQHRQESFENARDAEGLSLVEGPARFASEREVLAAGRRLQADKIFIATGMRPLVPTLRVIARSEDGVQSSIEGTHLLVAAGRAPNSDLDLHRAGVETDHKGFVKVNDFLETNVPEAVTLKVIGMTCSGCEAAVRNAARQLPGVSDVTASYERGVAEVIYDPRKTTPDAIARAITEGSGFETVPPVRSGQ